MRCSDTSVRRLAMGLQCGRLDPRVRLPHSHQPHRPQPPSPPQPQYASRSLPQPTQPPPASARPFPPRQCPRHSAQASRRRSFGWANRISSVVRSSLTLQSHRS
eukprot:Rmarinus@m.21694